MVLISGMILHQFPNLFFPADAVAVAVEVGADPAEKRKQSPEKRAGKYVG
jgi:hypothetical protein